MAEEWITTTMAVEMSGYHVNYIRYLIRIGAVQARKFGTIMVPLGSRRILGIVMGEGHDAPAVERFKAKPLVSVVEKTPVVPPELLRFLRELAAYYLAPMGDVLRLAMPSA